MLRTTQYDTIRHITTRFDTISDNSTQHQTIRHTTTHYDTVRHSRSLILSGTVAPGKNSVNMVDWKCCKCGQPQGVAHTAFKFPELVVQRQSLISALDAERADMVQDSAWGNLTDARKLAQDFILPIKGWNTVSARDLHLLQC